MIAFDFNIYFQDEPSLGDGDYCDDKEDFIIQRDDTSFEQSTFKAISENAKLSGRTVRYYAENEYNKCTLGCRWGPEIEDVIFISWRCGEHHINYAPLKGYTTELLEFWILHTVLPMALVLEKKYQVLHVAAVEINNKAILFSALSYGGKSTLTDCFMKKGEHFFCDDTLGVILKDREYFAISSYPYHRPFRKAESLGYANKNWVQEPKPIAMIFVLKKGPATDDVVISELKGVEKYTAFHHSVFLNFDFLKQDHFSWLGEMLNSIPVYNITVPWDLERLDDVYQSINTFAKNRINNNYGKMKH